MKVIIYDLYSLIKRGDDHTKNLIELFKNWLLCNESNDHLSDQIEYLSVKILFINNIDYFFNKNFLLKTYLLRILTHFNNIFFPCLFYKILDLIQERRRERDICSGQREHTLS